MSNVKLRFTRAILWLVAGTATIAVSAQVASAASTVLTVQGIGASGGQIAACSPSDFAVDQLRTGYSATPSPRIEIRSVRFATVPAGCAGRSFTFTVLDNNGSKSNLGSLTGTVPAAGSTVSFATGTGPQVNSINVTNFQVVLSLAVYQ